MSKIYEDDFWNSTVQNILNLPGTSKIFGELERIHLELTKASHSLFTKALHFLIRIKAKLLSGDICKNINLKHKQSIHFIGNVCACLYLGDRIVDTVGQLFVVRTYVGCLQYFGKSGPRVEAEYQAGRCIHDSCGSIIKDLVEIGSDSEEKSAVVCISFRWV